MLELARHHGTGAVRRVDELAREKMKNFHREQIIQFDAEFRANDMARLIKILIAQIGKDKAKEIYEKKTYDDYYRAGRETGALSA